MRTAVITILVLASLLASGCDKSSEAPKFSSLADSADLLGLERNHTLEYIIYDSIVTYVPEYSVAVDTIEMQLEIARGADSQVQLSVDGIARHVLTIDAQGILHTGSINSQVAPPETLYYSPTPILMPREYTAGSRWTVVSPQYAQKSTVLFIYDGYLTERTFKDQTDVVLPTGSYGTFHFQSILFLNETAPDTVMMIDEYFAEDVGLVQMICRGGGSRRLIILLEDH